MITSPFLRVVLFMRSETVNNSTTEMYRTTTQRKLQTGKTIWRAHPLFKSIGNIFFSMYPSTIQKGLPLSNQHITRSTKVHRRCVCTHESLLLSCHITSPTPLGAQCNYTWSKELRLHGLSFDQWHYSNDQTNELASCALNYYISLTFYYFKRLRVK